MLPGIWDPDADTPSLMGQVRQSRLPIKLMVSLIEKCNLKCFHCLGTQVGGGIGQTGNFLSREFIDFITKEIMPGVRFVRLGGVGNTEQLIAPHFDYFVESVRRFPLEGFQLTTNLSVLPEARAKLIAESMTEVQVSLEGVEENFTLARRMPWRRFRENFARLRVARDQAGRGMKLVLLVCAVPRFFPDLLRFDLFQEMGVNEIILRELIPFSPELVPDALSKVPVEEVQKFIAEFKAGAEAVGIHADVMFGPRFSSGGVLKTQAADCHLPFETMTITGEGRMGVCCSIPALTRAYNTGTLRDRLRPSVGRIWNGRGFRNLRATVNQSEPGPTCQRCEVKTR